MAVDLTLKSAQLTNREATPRVLNNPGLGSGARVKCAVGYFASITLNLSITSRIRMVSIPSNAIGVRVELQSGAQTAGKVDVGLYRTNGDGGAVVDADFFASAVDLASAVALADVQTESTVNTMEKQSQPIWQAAGMSTNPNTDLDVVLTVVTTDFTTAAAPVLVKVWYMD